MSDKIKVPGGYLLHYGGDGKTGANDYGEWEVRFDEDQSSKRFTSYEEALRFYDSLMIGKALWDNRHSELIDAWTFHPDE